MSGLLERDEIARPVNPAFTRYKPVADPRKCKTGREYSPPPGIPITSGSFLPAITPLGLHPKLLGRSFVLPSGPVIESTILSGQIHLSLAMTDPSTRKSGSVPSLRNAAKYFVLVGSAAKERLSRAPDREALCRASAWGRPDHWDPMARTIAKESLAGRRPKPFHEDERSIPLIDNPPQNHVPAMRLLYAMLRLAPFAR